MRKLRLTVGAIITSALVMAGPHAASATSWGSLRPTYEVLDIVKASARGDAGRGTAQVRIAYSKQTPSLSQNVVRIAFGREQGGGCRTRFPMTLVIEIDFPRGGYQVFTGDSYAKPSGTASVKMKRLATRSWEYSIKSPHLKRPGINCVWVAVGEGNDWEWFVNAGAFEGNLPMS